LVLQGGAIYAEEPILIEGGMISLRLVLFSLAFLGFYGRGAFRPGLGHSIKIVATDEGFLITDRGSKVLFYQRRPKSLEGKYTRANYIHPLHGLDGEVLTEDFPADHRHHRGIFWAWHQLYVGDRRLGDSWSLEDFICDVCDVRVVTPDKDSRGLQIEAYWKSPLFTDSEGRQKPFVKESTTILVHRAEGDIRKVDFAIRLLALEDGFRIGGSEKDKAYGGFSTRIRLPDGMQFVGTDGPVEPELTPVEGGPWLDFSGPLGEKNKISGLAILCHKSNPGYPQLWILRRERAMQNPIWPGRHPVPLSCEKPLTLRYRLIIHRGDASHMNLDELQAEYNEEGS
jgi:hypothetical protein